MKNRKKFSIYLVCMVIWMGVIFSFSAQPAEESTNTSVGFGMKIADIFVTDFRNMPENEQMQFVERYDFWIRKTAHFCEYTVLGILCALMLVQTRWKFRKSVLMGTIICALAASSDEIHQLFVSGRAGRWQDVCIDTAGALTGIVAVMVYVCFLNKERCKDSRFLLRSSS